MAITPLEGFTHTAFTHAGAERTVYVRGDGLFDEAGHPTREALDRVLGLFREGLRS